MARKTLWLALSAACLAIVGAAPAAAPQGAHEVTQLRHNTRLVRVSDDVYAFVFDNVFHAFEGGNTTVILTDDGVVVVDAPDPRLSRLHLEQIRRLTRQPVRYVVLTHWHPDHIRGAHVYRDAFPNVSIIAQRNEAEIADRRIPRQLLPLQDAEQRTANAERRRQTAETGINAAGIALSGYALQRARDTHRDGQEFIAALDRNFRYVSPDLRFDDEMVLRVGGKEIRLYGRRGHTTGDTIVHLPEDGVLITGDILTLPVPFGANDFKYDLLRDYDFFESLNPAAIVPGHGDVQFDRTQLTLMRRMYRSLLDQAEAAVALGRNAQEFQASANLEEFRALVVGDDEERQWGWDNYFWPAAAQGAYDEAYGIR